MRTDIAKMEKALNDYEASIERYRVAISKYEQARDAYAKTPGYTKAEIFAMGALSAMALCLTLFALFI